MKEFILKFNLSRVYPMSFILLSCLLISKNTFSATHWHKEHINIKYDQKKRIISLNILFYDISYGFLTDSFLENCTFDYSIDGVNYTSILMRVRTSKQKNDQLLHITMFSKKRDEQIRILNCVVPKAGSWWSDAVKEMNVEVKVLDGFSHNGSHWISTNRAWLSVEWNLPASLKSIKTIRVQGSWKVLGTTKADLINQIYSIEIVKSNSIRINISSELKSETSNMKVTSLTDVISVKGAKSGENIKIYTVSGGEVKSVVANNSVVNIKLPKNQKYFVKIGELSYKVAL